MSMHNEGKTASAVRLGRASRACLTIIGLAAVVGIFLLLALYRRADPPDLLLTTLAVGALVSFLFAVVGRLPSGFELAGMKFDFPEDRLADLIGTVKSSLDDDPRSRARILELIEDGAGTANFKAAEVRLEGPIESDEFRLPPSTTAEGRPSHQSVNSEGNPESPEDWIDGRIGELAQGREFQKRFEVVNSGKGKAPIFDYYFKRGGAGVVVEVEKYWNPTTVDLISRKTDRALGKTTDVAAVIVIAPDAGTKAFNEAIETPSALVVSRQEFQDPNFESRLDGLLTSV